MGALDPAVAGALVRHVAPERRRDAIALRVRQAELPELAGELPTNSAGVIPTANRAGRCDGRAPEGTSGVPAAFMHYGAANARLPAQPDFGLSPDGYLRPAPELEDLELDALLEDGPDETDPDLDRDDEPEFEPEDLASFEVTPRPPRDLSRFVAAMRAKPSRPAPAARGALPVADSREECRRCGIPGAKGCAHQAPYTGEILPPASCRGQAFRLFREC